MRLLQTVAGRSLLGAPATWHIIARYLGVIAVGNLFWEALQLPLFTLWRTATPSYLAFAALHCWVGDVLIASVSLGCGILVAGRTWLARGYVIAAAATLVSGLAYTVFSEWLNVTVRGSWAYAPAMPRLPPLGTGLSPLLQWVIVPLIAFAWARPHFAPIKVMPTASELDL